MAETSANSSCIQRLIMCALCSWALAMVNYKDACFYEINFFMHLRKERKNNSTQGCPYLFADSPWEEFDVPYEIPEFFWNPSSVEIAFSAFYMGKMLSLVPAGMLSDMGYPGAVLGGGMLLLVIHHFLVPISLVFGFKAYAVLCIVIGASEAMIYPSTLAIVSQYTPVAQRNTFVVFVVSGFYYGTTMGQVCFNVFLTLVKHRPWIAWNLSVGVIGTIWLVCWTIYSCCFPHLTPNFQVFECQTPSISRCRRNLISILRRLQMIPWSQMMTSRAFLSLILVFCTFDFAAYLNAWRTIVPYQKHILHLPADLARFSNLTSLAVLPTAIISALLVDWAVSHKVVSNTALKKSLIVASALCSSVLQVAMIQVGCNVVLFLVLAITKSYVVGLAIPVIFSTPVDLSPRDAGLLIAILTGASSICYLFDMEIYRILLPDINSWNCWRKGFFYFSVITFAMVIPFLFFGSGEHQKWRMKSHRESTQGSKRNSAEYTS